MLKDIFYRIFDLFRRQVRLFGTESFYQFGLSHSFPLRVVTAQL
ncbi:Uncharacterised protein [Vibrio cholerae]|nr:Uncharacterised protein [Vibrio cholerae]CSC60894.1 Uncharacterised protein [Vibrio cholerae]